ncbi:hypothetical protein CPTAKMNP4_050 [Salmonella phage vB_SenM-AKM_NP4]|uniref:Uncharacterized protein n=5 Tax=Gelderlandvirus TaxID=1913653 RepID=M1EA93_BPS16|nr:hypothetical protein I133_gp221 [Salmonella phage vB_SenM-S16]YP_009126254.1 hypothetical protein STP4a_046 [Salmonella phage STP4-a]YP_009148040.1 hypothetical protein ACQ31_gp115 [Salmonella phage STML-198]YP_009286412.1 hypothetical protein BI049_gp046 [Salmonella phage vB_SnwM_CGG4-1]YP_009615531.1 hypothetical protein FDI73_gp045 [Salmonella phage Melville]UFK27174.1 hypothetical protein LG358_00153 [Escherichia phage UoN_LG358_1]UPW42420.1 hypothetical protein EBPHNEJP_00122 [Salmone
MTDFKNGQQLLAVPEIKRYILTNNFSGEDHLVTEIQLRDAFKDEYVKIMSNRNTAWTVIEYFD